MNSTIDAMRDFVHTRIREAAKANWQPVPEPTDDFNLVESGLFDSLGFVALLSAMENQFHFTMDPAELESEDLSILRNLLQAAMRSAAGSTEASQHAR
ncbi:MAG TPA: phosphopantetheine-binding protein [Bryobacteraceae bacterium]|nr:phosphopantetheine-binding protein [Bryobacteraceae bacterium]